MTVAYASGLQGPVEGWVSRDKLAAMDQANSQVLKFHRITRAMRDARSQGGGKSNASRGTTAILYRVGRSAFQKNLVTDVL